VAAGGLPGEEKKSCGDEACEEVVVPGGDFTFWRGSLAYPLEGRRASIPGDGEVRIAVRAAGVNFVDIFARMGIYPDTPTPPFVPGYEVEDKSDLMPPVEQQFCKRLDRR
jgi:hypothetical protein